MIQLSDLYALRGAGFLSGPRFQDAVLRIRDRRYWATWALRALLALGAGHFLAGVIFFFAYNWADMPAMAKFGVIEAALLVSALGALFVGIRRPAGQALLIAATIFVGALLAVTGQIYQTGADAYELFVAWSLLVLPWTLASRNAVQWLLWLAITYAAVLFACGQVLVPLDWLSEERASLLLGALLAAALAGREGAARSGISWMAASWTRYLLLVVALGHFFAPAIGYVFDMFDDPLGVALLLVALGAAAGLYHRILPDFAAFALTVAFAGFFLMAVGGRVIAETVGFDDYDTLRLLASLGLLVAWCVGITGGMGKLLQVLRRQTGSVA